MNGETWTYETRFGHVTLWIPSRFCIAKKQYSNIVFLYEFKSELLEILFLND